jgi:glutamate 5-kinase
LKTLADAKRVVIKIGTSTLTYETGRINIRRFEKLCKTLSDIKNSGREIVLVSSGAVAVGVAKMGLPCRPQDIPSKQAAAAVGQCELMYLYDKLFLEQNHKVAQVLLTRDVLESENRAVNARNTFERLFSMGAIPIVNENDTVSIEELEFGDNDTLSAMVTALTEADGLILLSDIDGLYAQDPRKNPEAQLIPLVTKIDKRIESIAGGSGSNRGTGGMATKIQAAKIALVCGAPMAIINGADPDLLYDLFEGKPVGTLFLPEEAQSLKPKSI